MNNFKELQELVKKKGYGSFQFSNINGTEIYLSRGVQEMFLGSEEGQQQIISLVTRFQNGDYGDAAAFGKESRPGHEYGRYACVDFEDAADADTGVWAHKADSAIIVYFKFER